MRTFSSILIAITLLSADNRDMQQATIAELANKIKSSKVEDRRVLINQLKIKLRTANQATRKETMMSLRKSFSKEGAHQKNHAQHRYKIQGERAHRMQEGKGRGKGKHQGKRDGGASHKGKS